MQNQTATELIQEMLADPIQFEAEGRANDLLQYYFDGFPLDTLRPLLQSSDVVFRGAHRLLHLSSGARARIS